MKLFTRREWAVLFVIVIFSSLPTIGGLVRLTELAGGPSILPKNPRALASPWPIILHILGNFVFCIAGAIQFLPSLRRHYLKTHKMLGRVMVIAGVLSASTGLWMTFFFTFHVTNQGDLLFSVRVILGFAMIGLLGLAIIAVKARSFKCHGASMLRAYAIGQGASTQALLGIAWILSVGAEPTGFFRDCFMVFCWILNLLVAEALIHFLITKPAFTTKETHEVSAL